MSSDNLFGWTEPISLRLRGRRTPSQLRVHAQWQRAYVANNRETVNAKQRAYAKTKRAKVLLKERKAKIATRILLLLTEARKRARKKGLPFTLTPADIKIPAICPVLGIPIIVGGARANWPSIDRIKPQLGYVVGNIAVISHRANSLKNDASLEEVECIAGYLRNAIGS